MLWEKQEHGGEFKGLSQELDGSKGTAQYYCFQYGLFAYEGQCTAYGIQSSRGF